MVSSSSRVRSVSTTVTRCYSSGSARSTTSNRYDAIVIGLGGVGSFALRGLVNADGGGKFLGIEQFTGGGHDKGSSHGESRIYRQAYFEHVNYVPWLQYSLQEFKTLDEQRKQQQSATGESKSDESGGKLKDTVASLTQPPLVQECGTLLLEPAQDFHGPSSSSSSSQSLCRNSLEAAQRHGIPVQEFTSTSALQERFPQFQYGPHTDSGGSDQMVGLYEPGGGYLRPESILQTVWHQILQSSSSSSSVDVVQHAKVVGWNYLPGATTSSGQPLMEVRIRQHQGTQAWVAADSNDLESSDYGRPELEEWVVTTPCLLVAAGAWTSQLIPQWAPYLQPHRQLQGWIDTSSETGTEDEPCSPLLFGHDQMPTWIMVTNQYPLPLYGVPADVCHTNPSMRGWIKIGIHGRDDPLSNPSKNPITLSPTEWDELRLATQATINPRSWRNGATGPFETTTSPQLVDAKPCMYTMTPDKHFIIGSPYQGVFAVSGLSGHGFKQVPALGQMMVDYAIKGETASMEQWDYEFCSPSRFGLS